MGRGAEKENNYDCHGFDTCGLCCICGNRVSVRILQAWMLLVTTLTISTVEAFRGPASAALTPKVLEKEYYEYGISLSTTLSSMVELIGTAVAAAIIAVIGTSGAIYVDMTTFLLSALIIVFVNTKEQGLVKQKFDRKTYVKDLADGFSYVKKMQ